MTQCFRLGCSLLLMYTGCIKQLFIGECLSTVIYLAGQVPEPRPLESANPKNAESKPATARDQVATMTLQPILALQRASHFRIL